MRVVDLYFIFLQLCIGSTALLWWTASVMGIRDCVDDPARWAGRQEIPLTFVAAVTCLGRCALLPEDGTTQQRYCTCCSPALCLGDQ